jgi:hypothetical protein
MPHICGAYTAQAVRMALGLVNGVASGHCSRRAVAYSGICPTVSVIIFVSWLGYGGER